ncbi:MAG: aldehyde dehydrogenase family protein [Bacteriovoracaceae bacterium]|nr:aldehyde dehydrogenase family protein [Bacteriovoracaceae bacterium]
MTSKHFGNIQMRGLNKLGDVIVPGEGSFPRFGQTEFSSEIDRMLDYMYEDDRSGLSLLMTIFAFTPSFLIKWVVLLSEKNAQFPDFIGAPLRMIQLGLKGIILTLYYSNLDDQNQYGEKIMKEINWSTTVAKLDSDQEVPVMRKETSSWTNPSSDAVTQIYDNARSAEKEIYKMTVKQRRNFITSLKKLILDEKEKIVDIIQKDTGKGRSDALFSEIFGVLDHLTFLENEAVNSLKDAKIKTPIALMGKKSKIFYEPLGTVLVVSPWNYPFYQAIVPITISFITGNSTIYKPSEFTPLKGLVEDLLYRAGFQDDWVQIVYGDGKTGSQLIDKRPDKIFFTGSVATGKKIMSQASEMLIPVELELGGKDPFIVFDDADIERAASGALWGALTNTGQSCTSVERIYVQENIYEKFKTKLLEKTKTIKQSVDKDGDSDMGGMTTDSQVGIVKLHIDDAKTKGANLLTGEGWNGKDNLIPPLVLDNISDDMKICTEETFGPILPLYKFVDEEHAINLANDSDFGLSASVWSADNKRALRVTRKLKTGNVSINNVMLTEGNPYLPFGGTKYSGIGRYKGVHGLHSFSNMKSVLIDSNSNKIEANWYPYTKRKYQLFSGMTEGLFGGGIKNFIKFLIYGLKLESYSDKVGKKGRV